MNQILTKLNVSIATRIVKLIDKRFDELAAKRVEGLVDMRVVDASFHVNVRERLCRKEFFYNAFKLLKFNEIDGDYVEFGCCGAMTFALAHHENVRHGNNAKLWAFDSFQGLPEQKSSKDSHPM